MAATETEVDVGVVLPPFEPFSPGTPSSRGETQTKVRIARLHMDRGAGPSAGPPSRAGSPSRSPQARNSSGQGG